MSSKVIDLRVIHDKLIAEKWGLMVKEFGIPEVKTISYECTYYVTLA